MKKKELKRKLIQVRNGAFVTPILEEIWDELDKKQKREKNTQNDNNSRL